jgi:hypothetical protein
VREKEHNAYAIVVPFLSVIARYHISLVPIDGKNEEERKTP